MGNGVYPYLQHTKQPVPKITHDNIIGSVGMSEYYFTWLFAHHSQYSYRITARVFKVHISIIDRTVEFRTTTGFV